MARAFHELALCDRMMADILALTPDKQVHELFEICGGLESGKGGVFK